MRSKPTKKIKAKQKIKKTGKKKNPKPLQVVRSISQVKMAQKCLRSWYFRYPLQIETEKNPEYLGVGSAVHDALEAYAKGQFGSIRCASKGASAWKAAKSHLYDRLFEYDATAFRAKAEPALGAGIDAFEGLLESGHEVVGNEELTEVVVGHWKIPGRYDLVTKCGGELYVWDYKTKRTLPSDNSSALDPQMAVYALHVMREHKVDVCYTGRIYLRAAEYNIKTVKSGLVSLQSICDHRGYLEHIAANPESALDPQKAEERFGEWYRLCFDYWTRQACERILHELEPFAVELGERTNYAPNFDPVGCSFCDYQPQCTALTLHNTDPREYAEPLPSETEFELGLDG